MDHDQIAARPFAVSSALKDGISPGELRGRRFFRPFFGVRSASPPVDEGIEASVLRRADAFAVRMASTEFFCESRDDLGDDGRSARGRRPRCAR